MPPEIIFLSSAKQNIQVINILEYFRMIIQLLPSYEVNIKLSMLEKKTATLGLTTVDVHLININFLGKTADVTVMTIHKLSEPTSGKL
jgi:hypothetical protein